MGCHRRLLVRLRGGTERKSLKKKLAIPKWKDMKPTGQKTLTIVGKWMQVDWSRAPRRGVQQSMGCVRENIEDISMLLESCLGDLTCPVVRSILISHFLITVKLSKQNSNSISLATFLQLLKPFLSPLELNTQWIISKISISIHLSECFFYLLAFTEIWLSPEDTASSSTGWFVCF